MAVMTNVHPHCMLHILIKANLDNNFTLAGRNITKLEKFVSFVENYNCAPKLTLFYLKNP